MMTKQQRTVQVNTFIAEIARCGRRFFAHDNQVSRFEVDERGHIWFVNAYQQSRVYTHHNGKWKGFSGGSTLRDLVVALRDFIRTGEPQVLRLGPWPDWIGGDLWGYGDDMDRVRAAAVAHGLQRITQPNKGDWS